MARSERLAVRREEWNELAVDDALAESFPASDPPAWNPGIAAPISAGASGDRLSDVRRTGTRHEIAPPNADMTTASRSYESDRTLLQGLISIAGAAAIALLVPFVILVVGLPFVILVRGLLEAVLWVFAAIG